MPRQRKDESIEPVSDRTLRRRKAENQRPDVDDVINSSTVEFLQLLGDKRLKVFKYYLTWNSTIPLKTILVSLDLFLKHYNSYGILAKENGCSKTKYTCTLMIYDSVKPVVTSKSEKYPYLKKDHLDRFFLETNPLTVLSDRTSSYIYDDLAIFRTHVENMYKEFQVGALILCREIGDYSEIRRYVDNLVIR